MKGTPPHVGTHRTQHTTLCVGGGGGGGVIICREAFGQRRGAVAALLLFAHSKQTPPPLRSMFDATFRHFTAVQDVTSEPVYDHESLPPPPHTLNSEQLVSTTAAEHIRATARPPQGPEDACLLLKQSRYTPALRSHRTCPPPHASCTAGITYRQQLQS